MGAIQDSKIVHSLGFCPRRQDTMH